MELLGKLGIDWKLLLAQLFNFLLLLLVLKKFLYKPVLNFLDQRKKQISESLDKARQIDETLKSSSAKQDAIMVEARKEAAQIIAAAQAGAEKIAKEKLIQTAAEAQAIVEKAKKSIAGEKEKLVSEARADISRLVVDATAKVLNGAVTKEVDEKYIERILKTV